MLMKDRERQEEWGGPVAREALSGLDPQRRGGFGQARLHPHCTVIYFAYDV